MANKASGRDYSYDKEYLKSPLQRKRNAARKRARYAMEKKGLVKKFDGKDVDHKSRNTNGNLSNSPSNLRVQTKSKNRGRNK
jgi:hypothetical protein